jgi:hypothetical protein
MKQQRPSISGTEQGAPVPPRGDSGIEILSEDGASRRESQFGEDGVVGEEPRGKGLPPRPTDPDRLAPRRRSRGSVFGTVHLEADSFRTTNDCSATLATCEASGTFMNTVVEVL